MNARECLHRKTLAVGEVKSGKTALTLEILRELIALDAGTLAVLDLAPERIRGIGGKLPLSPAEKGRVLLLSPPIVPPRMLGRTEGEVMALARENHRRIREEFPRLRPAAPQALIINDLSLFLQEGSAEELFSVLKKIPTVFMNGYLGSFFPHDSLLGRRERDRMQDLMRRCDRVIHLASPQDLRDHEARAG